MITSPTRTLGAAVHPIVRSDHDYDGLLDLIGNRRFVLIGEASHGTHEFYRERARITRRLIEELGFTAVAVEADFPDAARVNRYVMGQPRDADARAALSDFRRFPAWMWRNEDVVEFVEWLRRHNDANSSHHDKARFYGLDLYSLRASIEAVVSYLDGVDPDEADRARARYSCFDHVGAEGQAYGYAVQHNRTSCEDDAVQQLLTLREHALEYVASDGWIAEDELFQAYQNAVLVRDAEAYYREMYRGTVASWNLRDRHMAHTLDALDAHLRRQLGHSKIVVWEHNSHVGDARATDMGRRGELNVGQLVRQRHADDAFIIGLTTFHGEVTAASSWSGAARRMVVRPGRPDSHEAQLHTLEPGAYWLDCNDPHVADWLQGQRLERAIGVIYRPDTERQSHYFDARLTDQFDVVLHVDHTTALTPLDPTLLWERGEPPETFPTGILTWTPMLNVNEVLRLLVPIEHELPTENGQWFAARVMRDLRDLRDLLQRAEQLLPERAEATDEREVPADARQATRDLAVHRIELDLQHEELVRAPDEMSAVATRYTQLFGISTSLQALLMQPDLAESVRVVLTRIVDDLGRMAIDIRDTITG